MPLDSVSGLFTRIQMNLGRGAHATIVSYIPEWVNITQREVCKEARFWFCHAEDVATTLAAGDQLMTLPTDFLDDDYVFIKDADGNPTELTPMEFEDYRKEFTDLTTASYRGQPEFYLIRETDILFRPVSDDSYTVILGYWKMLADVVSGGASNKLIDKYPRVLECGATAKGFEYLQEYDDSQYWQGLFDKEVMKLKIANAEREFPDEMVLSVRPGQRSSAISGKGSRLGSVRGGGYYTRKTGY